MMGQALRVASKAEASTRRRSAPALETDRTDLEEAYTRIVEFSEALTKFRPLQNREADFLAIALDHLGGAYAERRTVPDDFDVVFVEQGRVSCEAWFRASRITVNRWLMQRGKRRLIEERAAFVRHQRTIASNAPKTTRRQQPAIDTYLPVARMAAEHLRVSRYGGWIVSQVETGGWRVGTVHRTSEELIAMAERQGFDREAAVTEAREEGY